MYNIDNESEALAIRKELKKMKLFKTLKARKTKATETEYRVIYNDNVIGWATTEKTFETEEEAKQYIETRRRNNTDPSVDWFII